MSQDNTPSAFRAIHKITVEPESSIDHIAWSPDNMQLASISDDKTLRIWDLTARISLKTLPQQTDLLTCLVWSPNGERIATGSNNNQIRIWDARTGKLITETKIWHTNSILKISWSPKTNIIASGSADGTVRLFDTVLNTVTALTFRAVGAIYSLSWSPDGQTLVSGSEDGAIRMWSEKGDLKRILDGHTGAVNDITWSPDGRLIASASQDKTIRIWGRMNGILEGHTDNVTSVSFSSDANLLASKSMDGTIRLWRTDTWETIQIIQDLSSIHSKSNLAFHPQQAILASVNNEDRTIQIWKIDSSLLGSPLNNSFRPQLALSPIVEDIRPLEDVAFTHFYPSTLEIGAYSPLHVYIHLLSMLEKVKANFEAQGDMNVKPISLTEKASSLFARGTTFTIIPQIMDVKVKPERMDVTWEDDIEHVRFEVKPKADAKVEFGLKGAVRIYVGALIAAELPIVCSSGELLITETKKFETETHPRYKKIFVSYSRKDSAVVKAIVRLYSKYPEIKTFIDYDFLQAADYWWPTIQRKIEEADAVQLFWSVNAAGSSNVEDEWRYALNLPRRIVPVILEPKPPIPPELQHIHFEEFDRFIERL